MCCHSELRCASKRLSLHDLPQRTSLHVARLARIFYQAWLYVILRNFRLNPVQCVHGLSIAAKCFVSTAEINSGIVQPLERWLPTGLIKTWLTLRTVFDVISNSFKLGGIRRRMPALVNSHTSKPVQESEMSSETWHFRYRKYIVANVVPNLPMMEWSLSKVYSMSVNRNDAFQNMFATFRNVECVWIG